MALTSAKVHLSAVTAAFLVFPAHAAVTISTAATQNMSCSNGVCTPTAQNAVLNVGDLENYLAGSAVTVNTGSGALAKQVEDIVVASSFTWANTNGLTFDAYRSITFNAPVSVAGSGAVSLVTNDGGTGGALSFYAGGSLSFFAPTNALSINGSAYTLVSNLPALATDIAARPGGHFALSASYDASQDGTYSHSPIVTKFKGHFNGLGNSVSNLSITSTKPDIGLFAYVMPTGTLSSVNLWNAKVSGENKETTTSVGILVGSNYGSVFNSFSSGNVQVKMGRYGAGVGGLAGGNGGDITNSASSASVAVTDVKRLSAGVAGGLVGSSGGSIENSYATGSVSLVDGAGGGLVGFNTAAITNCYSEGTVTVSSIIAVGGFVGSGSASITSSYSTGAPSGSSGTSDIGGFIGDDNAQSPDLSNNYWDTTTSGITNLSQGAGNIANDPGITGLTTAQLQSGLPTGFDPSVWAENPSINNGLPYLIANPPQ